MFLNLSVILVTGVGMWVGGECVPACIGQGCASQHAMGRGCVYPSMQWGRGGCMPLGPGEGVLASGSGGVCLSVRGGVYHSMVDTPMVTPESQTDLKTSRLIVSIDGS